MAAVDQIFANQPIVIDNGSGVIKAGFAGANVPEHFFPNYIGRPKYRQVMAGGLEGETFIGQTAQEHRGIMNIRYPMKHGMIENWNDMEKIWQYLFSKEQLNAVPEEHPILLTEAPLNPWRNREKSAEILFETFNVPALFISIQAVLSLYSSGRTTGVVLDSGDGVTHVVPIYQGFAIQHGIMRSNVAGSDVTNRLSLLLRKEGFHFHTSSEKEVVREMKEKICYVATNPQQEEKVKSIKQPYVLPDGKKIEVGASRYKAAEILFRPDLIGLEYDGVHKLLYNSINLSDLDLRHLLYQNIVISGGSTLFKNFGPRLFEETINLAPKDVKIKINASKERLYSTWIGGSILASLDTFKKIWITKREFESDPNIIHKKSF